MNHAKHRRKRGAGLKVVLGRHLLDGRTLAYSILCACIDSDVRLSTQNNARREVNLVFEESAGQIGEKQAAAEMHSRKEQQRTAMMQSETYAHLGSMLFGTDWTGER